MIKARGRNVFLDLKLHDIPATVSRAVEAARDLGVYSMTLHSAGGEEMLRAAAAVSSRPKLWAVTVLTSQQADASEIVKRAKTAKTCGMDGVIASAREITAVKDACGQDFTVVTPGIRAAGDNADDQKRTATAAEAAALGADFIVVGRPLMSAGSPAEAARKLCEEMARGKKGGNAKA